MNKLIVNLENITVALPEDKVIIEKEEYDMLKKNANKGKYMTMNELLELLSVSRPWLIENILYRPSIKNDIEILMVVNIFFLLLKQKNISRKTSEKFYLIHDIIVRTKS